MDGNLRRILAWMLLAAGLSPIPAFADVVKCVDAQGNASYTDKACPPGATQQTRTVTQGSSRGRDASSAPVAPSASSTSRSSPSARPDALDRAIEQADQQAQAKRREAQANSEALDRALEKGLQAMEAKRRDAQARCDKGDSKACTDAICARIHDKNAVESDFRACAQAHGYESGGNWVQSDAMRSSNAGITGRSVRIACLAAETLKFGDQQTKLHNVVTVRAEDIATQWHERNRFYLNEMGGPDFATWQEAASAACTPHK